MGDWGYNDDSGYDSDWGYEDENYGVGGYGIYDEGTDWGFDRGYGTETNWEGKQRNSRQSRGGMSSSQSGSSQGSEKQQCSVSGTVERVRKLDMRNRQNQSANLTVAQVELQDARDVLVAFKSQPQQAQRQLSLDPGQQIQARGKVGKINGRRILMAEQIRTDGRTFRVGQASSQSFQAGGSPAQFQSGRSQQPERGRVQETRRMQSDQGESTLLLIEFEDGRTALVDLGPGVRF